MQISDEAQLVDIPDNIRIPSEWRTELSPPSPVGDTTENLWRKSIFFEPRKSPVRPQVKLDTAFLNELHALAIEINNRFDDIIERQIFFSNFNKNLDDAWNLIPEEDQARDIILLLDNVIRNMKSEKLEKDQTKALVDITARLKRGGITEDDVDAVIDIILETKLNPIIPIKGLSKMYDL